MKAIPIPQTDANDYWRGTTGVRCPCGGMIEWAEAAYVPGSRACRTCLVLFQVRGVGDDRRLVPQLDTNPVEDAQGDVPDDELYHVPANLYLGWHQPWKRGKVGV